MSMFSRVLQDLFKQSKPEKKKSPFPDPACKPQKPGDPPPIKSPDGFCTTGREPRRTGNRTLDKMDSRKGWN